MYKPIAKHYLIFGPLEGAGVGNSNLTEIETIIVPLKSHET